MLKINEYFDGNVKSIGFDSSDEKSTVGVMNSGSYQFNTASAERMTVIKGALAVQLPNEEAWNTYQAGQSFLVAAHSSFKLQVNTPTAYLCEFLD